MDAEWVGRFAHPVAMAGDDTRAKQSVPIKEDWFLSNTD